MSSPCPDRKGPPEERETEKDTRTVITHIRLASLTSAKPKQVFSLLKIGKHQLKKKYRYLYQTRVPLHVFHQGQELVQFGLVNLKILTAPGKTEDKINTVCVTAWEHCVNMVCVRVCVHACVLCSLQAVPQRRVNLLEPPGLRLSGAAASLVTRQVRLLGLGRRLLRHGRVPHEGVAPARKQKINNTHTHT